MSLRDQLEEIRDNHLKAIEELSDLKSLEDLRVKLLGKKGPITQAYEA